MDRYKVARLKADAVILYMVYEERFNLHHVSNITGLEIFDIQNIIKRYRPELTEGGLTITIPSQI